MFNSEYDIIIVPLRKILSFIERKKANKLHVEYDLKKMEKRIFELENKVKMLEKNIIKKDW